jgi:Tfp pilus assembly protein PilN
VSSAAADDRLEPFRRKANQRRNRRLWLMPAFLVLGAVSGVVLGPVLAEHQGRPHRHLPWYVGVLAVVLTLVVVALEWLVIAWLHRRRHGKWLPEPIALLGADRPTRRRVRKAFRTGRLPDDPTDRALTVDAAQRIRRVRWVLVLWLVLIVSQLLVAIFDPRRPVRIFAAVFVVVYAVYGGVFWLAERRAARILEAGNIDG